MQAVIQADGDACVVELSDYGLAHNFGDTLRHYEEGYHEKLLAARSQRAAGSNGGGIASAHDRIAFRHAIEPADLDPDTRPRGMFEDCWFGPDDEWRPVNAYRETGTAQFEAAIGEGRLEKSYLLDGTRLTARYRARNIKGRFEIRVNLAMPSCDGYAGRYVLADGNVPCDFGQALDLASAARLSLEDGVLGGAVVITIDPPQAVAGRPHHTVSQSEAGFEKIMQATELTFFWPVEGDADLTVTLETQPRPAA